MAVAVAIAGTMSMTMVIDMSSLLRSLHALDS